MYRQISGRSEATELQMEQTLGSHLRFQLCQRKAFQMSLEGWSVIPPQLRSANQAISRFIITTAEPGAARARFGSGASVGSEVSELHIVRLIPGAPAEDSSFSFEGDRCHSTASSPAERALPLAT